MLRTINWLIGWTGFVLVRRHSVKMLIEYGNVIETLHPSHTGAARWIRGVARVMPLDEIDQVSRTVNEFLNEE